MITSHIGHQVHWLNYPGHTIFLIFWLLKYGLLNLNQIKGVNVSLAKSYNGTNVTCKDPSKFTIEGQATLVFKNANISDNGTYSLAVTLRRSAGQQRSEVKVVILGEKNVTNFIIYTIKLIYNCCNFKKNPNGQSCCIL